MVALSLFQKQHSYTALRSLIEQHLSESEYFKILEGNVTQKNRFLGKSVQWLAISSPALQHVLLLLYSCGGLL
jgi:hypothetical protein